MTMENNLNQVWSGFYKKSCIERIDILKNRFPEVFYEGALTPTITRAKGFGNQNYVSSVEMTPKSDCSPGIEPDNFEGMAHSELIDWPMRSLELSQANTMIENCIGVYGLPLGLGLNFIINDKSYSIPMAIEEPSVVAAVSGAAKTICTLGSGFEATGSNVNSTVAQVQLYGIEDSRLEAAMAAIRSKEKEILLIANSRIESMVQRGGGAFKLELRTPNRSRPPRPDENFWLIVHIEIDVCEAMGANCASTVAESVGPVLADLANASLGVQIVSNLNTSRLYTSKFQIPVDKLGYKDVPGIELARRIIAANDWARDDPFRCATHNKGIMNGIDAVAIATGQDWRAIEAGAHSFAAFSSSYRPLTDYYIEDGLFTGRITLPLSVGTKGGALASNPIHKYTLGVLGTPDSRTLCQILASVGLAQNFAALRALTSEGIQKGHMTLHANNIAVAAGVPEHLFKDCISYMTSKNKITTACAKEYLFQNK